MISHDCRRFGGKCGLYDKGMEEHLWAEILGRFHIPVEVTVTNSRAHNARGLIRLDSKVKDKMARDIIESFVRSVVNEIRACGVYMDIDWMPAL